MVFTGFFNFFSFFLFSFFLFLVGIWGSGVVTVFGGGCAACFLFYFYFFIWALIYLPLNLYHDANERKYLNLRSELRCGRGLSLGVS